MSIARRAKKQVQEEIQPTATEAAKKVLQEEAQKRVEACSSEIKKVLEKHNCDITVIGQFQGNQLQTQLQIIAKQ